MADFNSMFLFETYNYKESFHTKFESSIKKKNTFYKLNPKQI